MSRGLERARNKIEKRAAKELICDLVDSIAAFKKQVSKAPTNQQTIDELFRAVYENPQELELRVVLADALLEQGDPRGEFIALQCREHLGLEVTTKHKRRASRLLSENVDEWLGELKGVVNKSGRVFEAGFLTEAHISCNQERMALAVVGRIEWSTVRKLHIGLWPVDVEELIKHPVMRSLEEVYN